MSDDGYHKDRIGNHMLHPETLMLGYGYDPALSEGAVKPPVFLTSTFVFRSAEEGTRLLRLRRRPQASRRPARAAGLVYSRFNHPNSEIVEDRLAVYEGAEAGAAVLLRHVGDRDDHPRLRRGRATSILHSQPLYGGTETLIAKTLRRLRHRRRAASPTASSEAGDPRRRRGGARPRAASPMILIETPSNPINTLVDIALVRRDRRRDRHAPQGHRPIIVCDNTLLGPVFQKPLQHGADISLYSLTKYVGGHSDLIAGAALGTQASSCGRSRLLRGAIGTQLDPHSCWMLGRSLETLALRMERGQHATPDGRASSSREHPSVAKVHYLGVPAATARRRGASIERAMHRRRLDLLLRHQGRARRRRSASSTRCRSSSSRSASAAPSRWPAIPASTTHSGVPEEVRDRIGVTRRDDPRCRSASSIRTTSSPT